MLRKTGLGDEIVIVDKTTYNFGDVEKNAKISDYDLTGGSGIIGNIQKIGTDFMSLGVGRTYSESQTKFVVNKLATAAEGIQ